MKPGEDGGNEADEIAGSQSRSVSAPPEIFAAADDLMRRRMMTNFSEYVRMLIRQDVQEAAKQRGEA